VVFDIKDLAVEFTTPKGILQAVRGIDFHLAEGEILGIVGESGSGKSVTAHTLLGLIAGNGNIQSGTILYKGRSVLDMSPEELRRFRGREVGIIFQEPARSFDPIYPMEKAFAETILTHAPDTPKERIRQKSIKLLEEVQIPNPEERLSNFPHQFSGGMLQRIMIALSLASDPDVLIADEPTTALDVTIQAQIIQLLLDLKKRRNLSIIFISHNLALIGGIADRIAVMYGGLILENGPAETVLEQPHHPYTRALLDSLLQFGDHYSEKSLRVVGGTIPDPHSPEPGCPFAPRCPMRVDRCTEAFPEVTIVASEAKQMGGDRSDDGIEEKQHVHRCLFPGLKESRYAEAR
jgi:oligopeptide/dipeptide ABC transporter ATP-binding protein